MIKEVSNCHVVNIMALNHHVTVKLDFPRVFYRQSEFIVVDNKALHSSTMVTCNINFAKVGNKVGVLVGW